MIEFHKKEIQLKGRKYISIGQYAKKHAVPVSSVQAWIRQGQLDKKAVERIARVQYVKYIEESALPKFQRTHVRRKIGK